MKSTLALRCCVAVLGGLAIAAGAFWLGRQHPATPVADPAAAAQSAAPLHGGDGSISFRPFAANTPEVFAEMARMREQMKVVRSQALGSVASSLTGFGSALRPLSLEDKGDRYEAVLPAEGLENGALEVSVDGGMLVVKGDAQSRVIQAGNSARSGSSSFHYRMSLPADAEPGSLKTACHDNRIIITLQKRRT